MNILLELTLRGALMTAIIASLDRLCAAKINARVRRAWWLLIPLAFLVMIPLPILASAKSAASTSVDPHGIVAWLVDIAANPAGQATAAPSPSITASWALFIAVIGSAVYLLIALGRSCSALRRWSQVPLCTDSRLLFALAECKAEADITSPVGLVLSERVSTPLILGWWRPRILLPSTLVASLSREQLRGVLFHELAHLRSLDVPCGFLFTLVCALHWFNPAAHMALRRWAQFREEAADEAAIRWLGQISSVSYGETLLHVLRHANEQPAAPFLTLSIIESVSQLRTRLIMIKRYEHKSSRLLFAGAIFVAAALVVLRPVRAQNVSPQTESLPAATSEKPMPTPLTVDPRDRAALVAEFRKKGYKVPEKFVDQRVDGIIRENFHGDHAAFVETLTKQSYSEEKFRETEREEIMVQAMHYRLVADTQKAKAKALILPGLEINNLPLSDAMQMLASEVSRLVPKGQGMDIRLHPQAPQDAKVTLNLRDASLLDALQTIADQTNSDLWFSNEGVGIRDKYKEE